jgi:hypothetical protein
MRTIWVFINNVNKHSSTKQTFSTKTHKKGYYVGISEVIVFWPLASSVKPNGQTFALH